MTGKLCNISFLVLFNSKIYPKKKPPKKNKQTKNQVHEPMEEKTPMCSINQESIYTLIRSSNMTNVNN